MFKLYVKVLDCVHIFELRFYFLHFLIKTYNNSVNISVTK